MIFLKGPDINQGVERYKAAAGAVLLDVRTPEEYSAGHVPGSKNIPVQEIDRIQAQVPDKGKQLFVYCQSGARSKRAVAALQRMGYENAVNIGGFGSYHGKIEK